MAEDGDSKTEPATPARLSRAASEGDASVSREAVTFAALASGLAMLVVTAPSSATRLTVAGARIFAAAGHVDTTSGIAQAVWLAAHASLGAVLPVGGASLIGALVATGAQTRLRIRRGSVGLRLERLAPWQGLSRMFSGTHRQEVLVSLLRAMLVGVVLGVMLWHVVPELAKPSMGGGAAIGETILRGILAVGCAALAAQGLLAGADLLLSRRSHQERLRMSRTEIRDEMKESEGDPQVKGRLRAMRAAKSKQNLARAMARANVVVTNPAHYAVALHYEKGQVEAPLVVAKGKDRMAARIREIARRSGVPIIANPPLARALFRGQVDAEISPEHYKAVAEIIAYVWRLADQRRF